MTQRTELTTDQVNAVYDILVNLGGAHESDREMFLHCWPQCREYRFRGKFGPGGKIWYTSYFSSIQPIASISFYQEDETEERFLLKSQIDRALEELLGKNLPISTS